MCSSIRVLTIVIVIFLGGSQVPGRVAAEGKDIFAQVSGHFSDVRIEGQVVRILDGAQIEVNINERPRVMHLHGVVSSAEMNPTREDVYHQAAEQFLRKFIFDKKVIIVFHHQEKSGNVPEVKLYRASDQLYVNYQVIRLGFGHAQLQPVDEEQRLFRNAEQEARMEGIGLWGMKPPEKRYLNRGHGQTDSHFAKNDIIYLTVKDKKIHRDYCSQLREERIPMKYGRARAAGYELCTFCMPSQETNEQ